MAKLLIAADGVLAPEEGEMLADLIAEMGVDADIEITDSSIGSLCAHAPVPQVQAHMLLELASIAHVDNEYSVEERELLRTIAGYWNVDPITLVRIEGWAEMRIQLSREAAEVVLELQSGVGEEWTE